uniref:Uncharacterized protein n=1 Tax=Globisporangium ultimum (strain ATCC 200006 / CBS 805.95 / DAOM BR144) TaxID=431595 RepID=K3XC44_GLOUD
MKRQRVLTLSSPAAADDDSSSARLFDVDALSDLDVASTLDKYAHVVTSETDSSVANDGDAGFATHKIGNVTPDTVAMTAASGAITSELQRVPQKRAKFSAEVRKARHRDRMQRVRMAEKRDIEVKRVEMQALEVELENSIVGFHEQGDDEEADIDDSDTQTIGFGQLIARDHARKSPHDATNPKALRRKYVNLVLQQDQIKKENANLVGRIQDFEKYEKLATTEFERLQGPSPRHDVLMLGVGDTSPTNTGLGDGPAAAAREGGYWLTFTENEYLYFEPLKWTMCQEIARQSYNHMLNLQRGLPHPTIPTEFLGWKVSYATLRKQTAANQGVQMQHRSVKRLNPFLLGTLEKITIDSLGDNTWRIVNSSELYRQIYKTNMLSRVLQVVDDHTSVLLRTYPDERQVMRARFLSLISKMEDQVTDATGNPQRRISVLLSVLDPDEWLKTWTGESTSSTSPDNTHINWIKDGVAYFSFTDVNNGQEVEMEYGGYLDVASEEVQSTVMRNMLEAIIRFERGATRTDAMLITSS